MDQLTEYEIFRLNRKISGSQEDNRSAHFSTSLDHHTDRQDHCFQSSSRVQQPNFMLKYIELQEENTKIKEQLLKTKEQLNLTAIKLQKQRQENKRLKEQLSGKIEKQKITKGKLKQWVSQARLNLKNT